MDRREVRITDYDRTRIISHGPGRSLRDIRRRPGQPRGLRFLRGTVFWSPPERSDGVTSYRIYADNENNRVATVPAGQLSVDGITASRVFVSAFNSANGLESTKEVLNTVTVYPSLPYLSGGKTHRELQAAIDEMSVDGGEIWLGPGNWLFGAPIEIPADKPNIRIFGSGDATCIRREQDLASGVGLFNIRSSGCELRNFKIDGLVTTSVGVDYAVLFASPINGDPMHPTLSDQTSIWIHGGVTGTRISGVTITHTGGYAILIDANTSDVVDTEVLSCKFINNRPHKFGDPGDLVYGSWTGGIMYHNDGRSPSTSAMRGLRVANCEFRRCTGNCLWGHAYGFDVLNERINWVHNTFQDIGLDGIQAANVVSGSVTGNSFHRVGYVHSTDVDAAIPKYRANSYAVAMDTSGYVKGVDYAGNSMVSVNGGGIDLDGFAEGTVSGNSIIVPSLGDPRYTDDKIAQYGVGAGNITKGIQTGNTFYGFAARHVNIIGNTVRNCGTNAIALKDARQCFVGGNAIWHNVNPSTLGVFGIPIVLLSTSASDSDHQAADNVVNGNFIHWDIPQAQLNTVVPQSNYCIHESDDIASPVPGPNYVFGNRIIGLNYGEFSRGATSVGSAASMVLPTSEPITTANRISQTIVQREGFDATAATKWYRQYDDAGTQRTKVIMQLSDIGPSLLLYTVDNTGALISQSGRVLTGGRTSAGTMEDLMFSGKLIADGFLMIGNATFQDSDANQFPDTYGLIRYDAVGKKFQASTTVSLGARVWFDLTSGGGGGGVNQIIGTANQIEVTPPGGTGIVTLKLADAVLIGNAGLFTGSLAVFSTATNAIQAPNGFFFGKGLTATAAAYNAIQTTGPGGVNTYGVTVRQYANFVGVNSITPLPGDSFLAGLSAQIWYYQLGSRLRISGAFGLIVDGSGNQNVEGITLSSGYVNSAHGFQSPHTAFNTFQALNGGAYFKQCIVKPDGYTVEGSGGGERATLNSLGPSSSARLTLRNISNNDMMIAGRSSLGNYGSTSLYAILLSTEQEQVTIQASAQNSLSDSIVIRNYGLFPVERIRMGVFSSGGEASITLSGTASVHIDTATPGILIGGQQVLSSRKTDPGAAAGWADATAQAWANSLRTQLAVATGGHGLF